MESNIQQAYLIRDEKAQAANTAKRVGALLAALCADVADHDTRVAETKERVTGIEESVAETKESVTGIEESVTEIEERVAEIEESKDDLPAIDISAGFAVLDSYNAYDKCGIYRLTFASGEITAGILVVTSDNMGHVIDQWLVGNYTIRDGVVAGEHSDGAHTICVRSYGIMPSSSAVTKEQWTAWEYALCIDPTQPKEAYAKVVKWSGKVVDGILLQQLSAGASTQGQVVWDKGHKTFAFETTGGSYFNNWGTRTDYQTGMWTADAGQWSAGLMAGVFYSGDDGSLWVATSAAELERLTGSDVVDAALSADSENAVSNAAVTEAIIKTNSWTTEE